MKIVKMFNCPSCNKEMEQESQHTHSVLHCSDAYKDGKWIIPEYFVIQFKRIFWCKNCNPMNKYTFIDGSYRYIRERQDEERNIPNQKK